MMRIVGMRAPPGLLTRFIVCLKKDDFESSAENLELVLEYIVKYSDDLAGLFDEYYKTFRRKKLVWLFTAATVHMFKLLEIQSLKIRFLSKVVSVM
jgi:hypothetical protein